MGKFPWYFPYFLHSCRYNPTVDFLILTDNNDPSFELPTNVKIIPYSLGQFKTDAAKALGFDVAVESYYKLCDFKPAYGTVFADYIKEYDFWGYCDVDVIFGNIRAFMTDELLAADFGDTRPVISVIPVHYCYRRPSKQSDKVTFFFLNFHLLIQSDAKHAQSGQEWHQQ